MATKEPLFNVSIIGASGYTGAELLRILINHPNVVIHELIAERNAGKSMGEIYSHLRAYNLPEVISLDNASWDKIDIVFCCLPHATSQSVIKSLPDHLRVIDLSADFRLFDTNTYETWYGTEHLAPELQKKAVYGLSELFRGPIASADLVACPGCYPTGATLPLAPLVRDDIINNNHIIIDAKSGITGAGRSTKQTLLFSENFANSYAYNISKHRHTPEIEQTLSAVAADKIQIQFTPHIIPTNRGILSTIYVTLNKGKTLKHLRQCLEENYKKEAFVHVLEQPSLPNLKDVVGTNMCIIGIAEGKNDQQCVLVSAIDNLTKGSSGQAVQNMNIMLGLKEDTALNLVPLTP